jgi:hypothetical protein
MMIANALAILVAAIWAGLLWIGVDLTRGVAARHIIGYPNSGQISYYIGAPLAALAALFLAIIFFNSVKRSASLLAIFAVGVFLLLFPFLFLYGGGV